MPGPSSYSDVMNCGPGTRATIGFASCAATSSGVSGEGLELSTSVFTPGIVGYQFGVWTPFG